MEKIHWTVIWILLYIITLSIFLSDFMLHCYVLLHINKMPILTNPTISSQNTHLLLIIDNDNTEKHFAFI